jgi:HAD superfamily phosphatase (TIGR01668 family)
MLSFVTPHVRVESVLELEVEHLRALGLEGLLLDVDCTLKNHRVHAFSAEVTAWVRTLREAGIRLCMLSNGRAGRIGSLAAILGIPFVAKAFKPLPFGCHAGLKVLGLDRRRAAVVGDQVFADILAGRLAGMYTILVRPTTPEEPWFTRVKRPFERQVLRWTNAPPLQTAVRSAATAAVPPSSDPMLDGRVVR